MVEPKPTVFVTDDDPAVRKSLLRALGAAGLAAECFASGREFLDGYDPGRPGCLLLDLRMPGMSGLDVQDELAAKQIPIPVIFITGHGDVPLAVRALRAGAVDFIEKPYKLQNLLDRIDEALELDKQARDRPTDDQGTD